MPLTLLSGEGIELPLSEYNRLRAFQGGGWFWDHENQQVIREVLGDFLPRVEERPKGRNGGAVALFQLFSGGSEAAGKSAAVGARMNRVPRTEYQRLQRALEALKSKAQNPHTDPNARRVIEKFCLPDPAQNPELYRLHGSAWNRRLLVLWGCEREQGTSLAPEAALHKISVEPPAATFLRRLPLLLGLLLLLLLLALLAWRFWPRHDGEPASGDHAPLVASDSSGSPAPGSPPLAGADASSPAPTSAPTASPGFGGTPSATPAETTPGTDSAAQPARVAGAPTSTGSSPSPGSFSDGSDASPADGSASPPSSANGLSRPGSSPSLSTPGSLTSSPAPTPAPSSPSSLTKPLNQGSRPASTPGGAPSPGRPADPNPSSAAASGASPSPSDPTATSSAPTPPASADQTSRGTAGSTPTAASPALVPAGTPPRLEILHAPTSTPPHDGKLDLVLMAAAHEADGSLATVEISQWKVDGQPQQDRTGQDVTGIQLALTLPPGKHRVSFTGKTRGVPVECAAEVNVQIKSQGDVTVKSSDAPN